MPNSAHQPGSSGGGAVNLWIPNQLCFFCLRSKQEQMRRRRADLMIISFTLAGGLVIGLILLALFTLLATGLSDTGALGSVLLTFAGAGLTVLVAGACSLRDPARVPDGQDEQQVDSTGGGTGRSAPGDPEHSRRDHGLPVLYALGDDQHALRPVRDHRCDVLCQSTIVY